MPHSSVIEAEIARRRLPKRILHAGQQQAWDEQKRFNVLACGRRWGKTILGQELVLRALERGWSVAWGAPNYKYLQEPEDDLYRLLGGVEGAVVRKAERRILMPNGGKAEFWTLDDSDAGRSKKYHRWIIDEAAMVAGLGPLWQNAIRPTLTDFAGDAWFLSTPKGPSDAFASFYERGQEDGEWKSWRMPTGTNPHLPASEYDWQNLEAEGMPRSVYQQEYLAEFVMPAGAVFDCFDEARNTYAPEPGMSKGMPVYLGWDFGSANTACSIGFEIDGVLYVPYSYHASGDDAERHVMHIRGKLVAKERWAVGGSNSEDDIRDQFQEAGMMVRRPAVTGAGSYDARIMAVYRLLRTGKLKIAKGDPLIKELTSMRYKTDGDDRILDRVEKQSTYHRFDSLGYLAVTWGDPPLTPKKVGSRLK